MLQSLRNTTAVKRGFDNSSFILHLENTQFAVDKTGNNLLLSVFTQ